MIVEADFVAKDFDKELLNKGEMIDIDDKSVIRKALATASYEIN